MVALDCTPGARVFARHAFTAHAPLLTDGASIVVYATDSRVTVGIWPVCVHGVGRVSILVDCGIFGFALIGRIFCGRLIRLVGCV